MISPRLLGIGLLLGTAPALAAPSAPAPGHCPAHVDVRDIMTVSQYDHAGLDKLSKTQIKALNAWLSDYIHGLCTQPSKAKSAGAAAAGGNAETKAKAKASAAAAAAAFGKPKPSPTASKNRIESHIAGEFHGWTGDTVFRLTNGQVWKQAGPGYFQTDLNHPRVVIKKLLIGYVLKVDGYGKEVFVRRIR